MSSAEVALLRCSSYDKDEVLNAMRTGIELLGGIERFASSEEKILLKPNVLAGDPPERCVSLAANSPGRVFAC